MLIVRNFMLKAQKNAIAAQNKGIGLRRAYTLSNQWRNVAE
jgi:hypothetical protein